MTILEEVKKFIPISLEDDSFDQALIIHINALFFELMQLGIGPVAIPFEIQNDSEWSEFECLPEQLSSVKLFICAKTKQRFDTPTSSAVAQALKETVEEAETRLHWNRDYGT